MTDNTMREQFARLKAHERHANAAESRYWCEQYRMFAERLLQQQAAQSVPVMGEAVAWTSPEWLKEKGRLHGMTRHHPSFKLPLYRAPTTCITQAELDALRKDAERWEAVVIISQAALCLPSTRTDEENRMLSAYQAAVNAGLGIEPAIDAAIAKERQS